MRRFALLAPVLLLAVAARAQTSAGALTLRIYAKPEGQRLHLLVRTPMTALNGIALPYRGANGELDLARTELSYSRAMAGITMARLLIATTSQAQCFTSQI